MFWKGFARALVLVPVCLVVMVGWSSKENLSGNYKTVQQISDTTTVFFPRIYGDNEGPRQVSSADSSTSVRFASLVRTAGTGLGQFVFVSKCFPAGEETVYVGDIPYNFSGSSKELTRVKPVDVAGSTFQIEGMN